MSEHDPLLDAILASGVKLPTLGGIMLRLRALAANEQTSPAELAAAVGRDPALTGEFIRVANSPVFRTRTPARSVKAAITILGRTKTIAVITSTALRGQYVGIAPKAVQIVWAGSVAVADAAYRAAQVSRLRSLADLAYLAGLIHDAGIPVLLHRFPAHAAALETSIHGLDAAALAVDAATETDHAAIGSMVARNWKLPPEVVDAVFLHHRPAASANAEPHAASLAILIAIGRRLRDGPSAEWSDWAPLAAAHLGIDQSVLEQLEHEHLAR
jgi:HD-like signal output (HDOD) protein